MIRQGKNTESVLSVHVFLQVGNTVALFFNVQSTYNLVKLPESPRKEGNQQKKEGLLHVLGSENASVAHRLSGEELRG